MSTGSTAAEEFLRRHGAEHGVRGDWRVHAGPGTVEVSAWTADRFTRPEQATVVLERVLHELTQLGLQVDGGCEIAQHRDVDGDWRGHLLVILQPADASMGAPLREAG